MNRSKNKEVQNFLEEIMATDQEKFAIVEKLREIISRNFKETKERIMYGGIMFSNENGEDWAGVFVYKNHVSIEFGQGFKLDDPKKELEGSGKQRRHLKIKSISDIDEKNVSFFIKEAVALT